MKLQKIEYWAPALFWTLLLTVNLIRALPFMEGVQVTLHLETLAIITPLDFLTFALFYFVFVPRLMEGRKVILVAGLALLYWAAYSLVWDLVYYLVGRIQSWDGFVIIYKSSLGHTLLHALYAFMLRLAVDWFRKYKLQKELEKQNALTELALLRARINPHFLFNVLNNIHSFVHSDPDKTSYSLIKLSEIMRYMLYETNSNRVALDKEITHLRNFLELQRLRLQEQKSLKFEVLGQTNNVRIAPMAFIPFVENAFKHGKKNIPDGIIIRIEVEGGFLHFYCRNQIRALTETEERQGERIGLANIRRRLELLYPDNHELVIENDEKEFVVNLKIKLDDH